MAAENTEPKCWLISGCSTGFGREIALAALAHGDRVAVTARNPAVLESLCASYPQQALALALDVTRPEQIAAAVDATVEAFGRIDVLVNNAGYGYVAAVEEGEDDAVRALFETNFFGALALTQAVLPLMRAQGGGRIINNSSQAGLMANPGTGYYSASKYALEGLMEALSKEVAPLNIRVTSVEPGAFRTDWSGRSMHRSERRLDDYAEHVGSRLDMIADMDGKQPGDPVRGAQVFVDIAYHPEPPVQLLLGAGVLASYREKLAGVTADLDTWQQVTLSADYPTDTGVSDE
ncbi:SDR family NAD(P)-dependent oxidoreductase [Halieaceae bacterium IMCC14734]|uniref:SDR family NAD(P)-dependent oxidoreductase n=1 Tax=Candidatus Litorirhabdus singularis TaxID=2518993 RepID=A0ABT3TKX2_9GAMM|nr:oxidoreductase [Candidatus Litorirhabdus singularis]MCX2981992.1 SDR family NAD(P)-dependent oxidoreductase [Candidatus Litorirhabdus singularis]